MQIDHETKQEQKTGLSFRRTQRRRNKTGRTPGPNSPVHTAARVPQRSNTTGLIFQAILGAAACLALVGVVAQSKANETQSIPAGSPDAPPPAVFVHLD